MGTVSSGLSKYHLYVLPDEDGWGGTVSQHKNRSLYVLVPVVPVRSRSVCMYNWPHPNNTTQGSKLWSVCVCMCVYISGHMGIHEHVKVSHVHMISSNLFLAMCFHAVFHLYINRLHKFKHYHRGSNILQTPKCSGWKTRSIASWTRHDNKEFCHCFSERRPHMQRCLTHPRKSSWAWATIDRFKLTGLLSELSLLELWRNSQRVKKKI